MKLLTYLQVTKQVTRRDFEEMLKQQVISLNGEQVTSFSETVKIGDKIHIELPDHEDYRETIEEFPTQRTKLMLFHKPKGYVVSKSDPHNKTIYKILPENYKARYYIGRLDKDTTGLLLLSNDPALVDRYEQPRHNITKVYEVRINKPFKSKDTKKACKGVRVDSDGELTGTNQGEFLTCKKVKYYRDNKGRYRLTIVLTEGKNRHIRRLLKALGYKIFSLHRIQVDKRKLGDIKPGNWLINTLRK